MKNVKKNYIFYQFFHVTFFLNQFIIIRLESRDHCLMKYIYYTDEILMKI